jgi:hypothetical protein
VGKKHLNEKKGNWVTSQVNIARKKQERKKWEKIVYDSGGLRTLLCELKSRESFFFFFFLEFLVFIFPV